MIAGAAWWFSLPVDPPFWAPGTALGAAIAMMIGLVTWPSPRHDSWPAGLRQVLAALCALAASSALGAVAAQIRTASVAQTAFTHGSDPVRVQGWVSEIDSSDSGPRLRLLVRAIDGVASPPRFARVAVRQAGLLTPGRFADCRAVLGPPSGPMAPRAYDFARRAHFERLGAAGYAFGRCRPLALGPPPSWFDAQRLHVSAMRADLSAAIQEAAPGRGGAIAAAMITGDTSPIDKDTTTAFRNSGLQHLLSVSGVHMGVVGGMVFAAITWLLSLISPIALRFPVKKIAAVAALIALAAYLVISGSSVPALRSFIMACVAFGAILLDRPAISIRGVALSALFVTLILPESVLEPGFQMSFAATAALVTLFELLKRAPHEQALPTPGIFIGVLQGVTRGIGGVLLISLVAGLATDPFAIYHFQRFSIYSLPANLISEPIISFLVAPAACLAAVLSPFGLSDGPLQFMASALDLVAAIGQTFGARGEAVQALPQPPDAAFILCVTALLWACLWRGALRWGAVLFFGAGFAIYLQAPRPVAAFDGELRATFARGAHGWTLAAGSGRSTYARDHLGAMLGIAPPMIERLAPPETCSDVLCSWVLPHGVLLLIREQGGFTTCQPHAIVVSKQLPPSDYATRCRPAALITAGDLAQQGGAFIYADNAGLRIARAQPRGIRRAWTPPAVPDGDQE
ncbi:MAG: ComEC/Rec2 family competence protein [Vitreimonas sp.]